MAEAHEVDKRKRKKKRSHTQMVKKLARQKDFGNNLDRDTYHYLIRILELIRNDSSLPEKIMLAQNVYQEISGREIECACNQVGSRVIDSLLKYANLEAIQKLTQAFESPLRRLSTDKFASHILQKIIIVCADRGNRDPESNAENVTDEKTSTKSKNTVDTIIDIKPSEIQSYNNIVLKLSKYVLNNSEEFVFDTYANHVLRTVIECLAGLIEDPNECNKKSSMPDLTKRRPVIQEYKDLLIQSCDRLQKWPQFCEFGREQLTSGLIQCILYSLKDVDPNLTKTIIKKIRTKCFKVEEDEKLPSIFHSEYSIRILEACLIVAQPKTFKKLYNIFFIENLEYLCSTQNTNFSVQKLLDYCVTKEIFEELFDKVIEHFPKILKLGFTGILVSTGNACLRLQTKQGPFVNAMINLLKCDASSENQTLLVRCIITLKKPSQLEAESSNPQLSLHLHGSLIMQVILKFNKPIKAVNSLLEMNNEELLQLFGDPKGSRILDAFMDSKYVGEKSREKLCKKLHGTWAELAKSTHGSRCVDKIWAWARMNQKVFIMEELAAAGQSLISTTSGKIISMKLNVPLFTRDKKEWSQLQGKNEKTKAMFADIIEKTHEK
ncbi:PREDICTED: nucleolar protein 9 [Cyphomyrmex costatus]|uniref:Pumilio domain-containing protein C14orf21 n=1 Tax=Cyphomyrmex costatus TaxID=456900 RepID=A0A195CWL0_9HYME|nr:PREDICTED: nucleolar protein 9 [Cyphomyrmex costatus]KYN04922.1 Pumilio domain-containing protein C14orf21 [Cyphomyrmex costatus]